MIQQEQLTADLAARPVDAAEGSAVRGGQGGRVVNVRTEVGFGFTSPFDFMMLPVASFNAAQRNITNLVSGLRVFNPGASRFTFANLFHF